MDKKIPVLFMDDEALEGKCEPTVEKAIKELQNNNCDVTVCTTISEAIKKFYDNYYKIFILDIDMRKIKDIRQQRGTKAARVFRSLNCNSSIIMFSHAGIDKDWFDLSRYGISKYIMKKDGVDLLIKTVKELANKKPQTLKFPNPKSSGKIAVITPEESSIDFKNNLFKAVKEAGESFEPVHIEIDDYINNVNNDYVAVILAADEFSSKPSRFEKIEKIVKKVKDEHIIIASGGNEVVVDLLNLQPFRMINLNDDSWTENLKKAIVDATYWYGAPEVIDSDKEDFQPVVDSIDWDKLDDSLNDFIIKKESEGLINGE